MTGVAGLGGGYAEATPDAAPTVTAVLDAATPGSAQARLVILAGPPGVGKSLLARGLCAHLPGSVHVDKDWAAGGFILAAARQRGIDAANAYGHPDYWRCLRPLEYAGAMRAAGANLVGRRTVVFTGGWGPELAEPALWEGLAAGIAPSALAVLHLDAPPIRTWRRRMAARGSRCDSPWFERFAAAVTAHPVWPGARHIASDGPAHAVLQAALDTLSE